MSVDDLKEALKEGTQAVDTGRFRVDAQKALAKLRDFRLADPHHYVLEVARAAVLGGATQVEVSASAEVSNFSDEVRISFDGPPLSAETMEDLPNAALGSGKTPEALRAKLLALGATGALALSPKWVRVESGGKVAELKPPAHFETRPRPGCALTTVHVAERFTLESARDFLLGTAEAEALRRHGRRFPVPLVVNGQKVNAKEAFEEPVLACASRTVGPLFVQAALPVRRLLSSRLSLDLYGVTVVTRELKLPYLQVLATARDDRLRRNASGSDVLDDDPPYQAVLEAVEELSLSLFEELVARTLTGDEAAKAFVLEQLPGLWLRTKGRLPTSLAKRVDLLPLFPGPSGEWVTRSALDKELKAGRKLRFATRKFPSGAYTEPAVLMDARTKVMEALLPAVPRLDVAQEVPYRKKAAQMKARWEGLTPEAPELSPDDFLVVETFSTGRLRGQVGLCGSGPPEVRLLFQGRFVRQVWAASLRPLALKAVVDFHGSAPLEELAQFPTDAHHALVEGVVLDAVGRALERLLPATQLTASLAAWVRSFVAHTALNRSSGKLLNLPRAVRQAKLYPVVGGGFVSLMDVDAFQRILHRPQAPEQGLRSGEKVLVLDKDDVFALGHFFGGTKKSRLLDAEELLAADAETERRIRTQRLSPSLEVETLARVSFELEGVKGEVGLPVRVGFEPSLRILKLGVLLETCTLTPRYGPTVAVADFSGLTPSPDWDRAERDGAFERLLRAVREGERRLCGVLVDLYFQTPLERLPANARACLRSFLVKELSARRAGGAVDGLLHRVLSAPLFTGNRGLLSVLQLEARVAAAGELKVLSEGQASQLPADLEVVLLGEGERDFLVDALQCRLADQSEPLEQQKALAAYRARAEHPRTSGAGPKVSLEAPFFTGTLTLGASSPGAQLEVVWEKRLLLSTRCTSQLPLTGWVEYSGGGIDVRKPALPDEARAVLDAAVAKAERRLLENGLHAPGGEGRALLQQALALKLDGRLEAGLGQALLNAPVLPCTDGVSRSFAYFTGRKRVPYVLAPLEPAAGQSEAVVLATDAWVRSVLGRWKSAQDVGAELSSKRACLEAVESRPLLERIEVTGPCLRRFAFEGEDMRGEVALVAGQGVLELCRLRRSLGTVTESQLPKVVSLAVECDALTPVTDGLVVARDAVFSQVLKVAQGQVKVLAAKLCEEFGALDATAQEGLVAPLLELAVWHLSRRKVSSPLVGLPLLRTADGRRVSLHDLQQEMRSQKRVLRAMGPARPESGEGLLWWPRPGEESLLSALELTLEEAGPALDPVRDEAMGQSPVAVVGAKLSGQVRLKATVSGVFNLALSKQGKVVERLALPHPVGGVGQVASERLEVARKTKKAVRNPAFHEAVAAAEAALERALCQRLEDSPKDASFPAWFAAAVSLGLGKAGPLSDVLPRLELFVDTAGKAVSVGRVLEWAGLRKRVLVVSKGAQVAGLEEPVLSVDAEHRSYLQALGVRFQDASSELRRRAQLEEKKQARRLGSLEYRGEALVSLDVIGEGWRGQLVLPARPEPSACIRLVRDKVAVDSLALPELGVAGVLEHPQLPVDEDWAKARLSTQQRLEILALCEGLYSALASEVGSVRRGQGGPAAGYLLRYLLYLGVDGPERLETLSGAAERLCRAPWFETCDGRWVDLLAISERIRRRGKLQLLPSGLSAQEVRGEVVLCCDDPAQAWVEWLRALFGKARVEVLLDVDDWRASRKEEEPEPGSALFKGLLRLRREARLLYAHAFGRLSTDQLEEIALHRAGGTRPYWYDAKTKRALLDPDHPLVQRALEGEELRPERLYMLLSALYGEINRGRKDVTEADEARLLSALVTHLCANPGLLTPSGKEAAAP